jgi:menadiol prenyltransferase
MAPSSSSTSFLTRKGAWIPSTIRAVLTSTRPWSIPASLVPSALACALVFDRSHSLLDVILPVVAGMAVHLAANTTNTYFDYKKGLDKRETSDDRALVDGTVAPSTVLAISAVCYAIGASICAYYAYVLGPQIAGVAVFGLLLAFFYTAGPFPLKYVGFGDVTIGLCFGPLLMNAAAAAATHSVELHLPVVLLSLPIGLLTVAILHANNTRDMDVDRKAGAVTVAQLLGFANSLRAYALYFAVAYALTAYALAVHFAAHAGVTAPRLVEVLLSTRPLALLERSVARTSGTADAANVAALRLFRAVAFLVVVTLPWCISLVGRFSRRALATLPQATAQFSLLFGACVLLGLLPFDAAARLLLGVLFYLGGVNNILMWHHTSRLVHQKVVAVVPFAPSWLTALMGLGATVTQLLASVVFVLGGPYAREAAALLVVFLLPVTVMVHDLWNADYDEAAEVSGKASVASEALAEAEEEAAVAAKKTDEAAPKSAGRGRAGSVGQGRKAVAAAAPAAAAAAPAAAAAAAPVRTFLTDFDNEFVHFFKNVGMLGGLLVYLAYAE